jgi:hypothetical protein
MNVKNGMTLGSHPVGAEAAGAVIEPLLELPKHAGNIYTYNQRRVH